MAGFIRKHAIASFYFLALILGSGVAVLVALGALPSAFIILPAFSASLSGVIITAVADGKAGLKKLLGRLLMWRVGVRWWLFVLLFVGVAAPLGFLLNPLFGGDRMNVVDLQQLSSFIPMLIAIFVVTSLGEELGWTGFLTPRLQARHSALAASLIRSVLWWLWHFPVFILPGDSGASGGVPYPFWGSQYGPAAALIALFFLHQIPFSILYTWVFNNTGGSVLLACILHGAEVWLIGWGLVTGIEPHSFDNYMGYGLVTVAAAIIIVITSGGENLSRRRVRVMHG